MRERGDAELDLIHRGHAVRNSARAAIAECYELVPGRYGAVIPNAYDDAQRRTAIEAFRARIDAAREQPTEGVS